MDTNTTLPQLTLINEAEPPTESELYAMTTDQRLSILAELREYMIARKPHEIPEQIAQFGVLISRKLRSTAEMGGEKKPKARAKTPAIAAASDDALF